MRGSRQRLKEAKLAAACSLPCAAPVWRRAQIHRLRRGPMSAWRQAYLPNIADSEVLNEVSHVRVAEGRSGQGLECEHGQRSLQGLECGAKWVSCAELY